MEPADNSPERKEFVDFVRAYEVAWAGVERAELRMFLPDRSHPLYIATLRALVCLDLEHRRAKAQPKPLEDYRSDFPDLFEDEQSLVAITFEDYQLRRRSGEDATPGEYEDRFGVDVTSWPDLRQGVVGSDLADASLAPERPAPSDARSRLPADAASAFRRWRRRPATRDDIAGGHSVGGREERSNSTMVVDQPLPAEPAPWMPGVGSEFLGFRLLAALGQGTYGRVYLARQGELADRLVVLKTARHLYQEPQTLAQLRHAHIVPIYSLHQSDECQAVCMPFLGMTTFEDIVKDLQTRRSMPGSGKYFVDRVHTRARQRRDEWGPSRAELRGPEPSHVRIPLEGLSYVDAVLWLAVRLADALAHAHERGIVHRDVKPANILLTDDGQPMLLDFNLAEDGKSHRHYAEVQVGGTARYIAPEQWTARQRGTWPADERTDLYSFGLVLHELLTGQHPFQPPVRPVHGSGRGGDEEWRRPVEVRRKNPAVSPGLEAIVRHCLEPDPGRRYRTARELREDLQCQSDHLPLQRAREPSLRERAHKWMRRHPRLVSSAGVGAVAAPLILGLAGASLLRIGHRAPIRSESLAERARSTAVAAQLQLHDDLRTIEFLLGSLVPNAEREQREEGLALARQAVARHGVLESPHWQETPLVAALTPEEKRTVRDDMGELLLLLAGASAEPGRVDAALRLNDLAAGCYAAEAIPRAIWQQRAELLRSAGRVDEAKQLLARAEGMPAHAPRDRYLLLLTESRRRGRLLEALPLLKEASRLQRDNFSLWLILGNCYIAAGKRTEAVECYDMAGALWPESHWPSLCRGLAFLEQGNDRRAIAAFDEVIRVRPETSLAYYDRALAKSHVGDLSGAEADLTALLDRPNPPLRGYFLRASIRNKRRDREGARRDQQDGLRAQARDERDLTARGLVKQPRDPNGALADYNSALELDPRYPSALQNKANVLGEVLGRTEEALATLDTLIAVEPDNVPAIAGRGVLNGRLGRREAAHADAREALRRDTRPFNIYQVAGIYALTSRGNPDDRREALRLLESALRQGVGLDLIDRDRDLDAIRDRPEFRRLVAEMRARRTKAVERATAQASRQR